MTYVVTRIYSGTGDKTAEELNNVAMQEVAPRLAAEDGFLRYITMKLSDGRVGAFSALQTQQDAHRNQEIVADLLSTRSEFKGITLAETLEGEVAFSAEGSVPIAENLHGVIRLYQSNASLDDLRKAFEAEGPAIIRDHFFGLSRYTVAKLKDGRVA